MPITDSFPTYGCLAIAGMTYRFFITNERNTLCTYRNGNMLGKSETVHNLWVARWVIIYKFRGNSNDGPNQTAEALLLLLLGIDDQIHAAL